MARSTAHVMARSGWAGAVDDSRHDAQLVLDAIGEAVLTVDLDGNVTYLNPVAESMTGWSTPEVIGRPCEKVLRFVDADTRESVRSPLAGAMRGGAYASVSDTSLMLGRGGLETVIESVASPVHDRTGDVTGAVLVFHDVSAARALSRRMAHLAHHDALTGLPNRILLADRLDQAIAAARRHGSSLAVLFMDLDDFKLINDRIGHAAGDQVLQSVARRLVARVRRSDTVSRLGGDEFVVLLSEVTCPEDASHSASDLLAAIAAPERIEDRDLRVTASVGISMYPADGSDPESLLKKADLAMLASKAQRSAWSHRTKADSVVAPPPSATHGNYASDNG